MEAYKNLGGDSAVTGYEIGADYITVWFKTSHNGYRYSNAKTGSGNVQHMKSLAVAGSGLNTFINQNKKTLGFDRV